MSPAQGHSLCSHLAGNTSQPMVNIPTNGRASFHCAACAGQRFAAMLSAETNPAQPNRLAAEIEFMSCGHHRNDPGKACLLCVNGVTAYTQLLGVFAQMDPNGRALANRLRKFLNRVELIYKAATVYYLQANTLDPHRP